MTTATVTAIEPTMAEQVSEPGRKELQDWEIKERTQRRAEYEYEAALCEKAMGSSIADYHAHLAGRIIGKTAAEISEDLKNVES